MQHLGPAGFSAAELAAAQAALSIPAQVSLVLMRGRSAQPGTAP